MSLEEVRHYWFSCLYHLMPKHENGFLKKYYDLKNWYEQEKALKIIHSFVIWKSSSSQGAAATKWPRPSNTIKYGILWVAVKFKVGVSVLYIGKLKLGTSSFELRFWKLWKLVSPENRKVSKSDEREQDELMTTTSPPSNFSVKINHFHFWLSRKMQLYWKPIFVEACFRNKSFLFQATKL